jgi:hypothetical protein
MLYQGERAGAGTEDAVVTVMGINPEGEKANVYARRTLRQIVAALKKKRNW